VARAHRIGQSKPVRVVRLITAKSVEEVVLRYASAVTGAVMAVA
jgi:SNF2 family DNA or RNA helicase